MTKENKLENPLKQELELEATETKESDETEPQQHLRNFLIQYTGLKMNPENEQITLEMLINVLVEEFPEVVMAIAEENFMRGYQQGLQDTEMMANIPDTVGLAHEEIETGIIDAEILEPKKDE